MDGILNLWKPSGMTSHDAVAAVRRLIKERRVGHAGTLDPMAEGVLVLGIGQGTRLLEYLVGGTKEYYACIHLGVTTDSDDAEGAVVAVTEVKRFRRPTIERVLHSFTGQQEQLPPTYSALKTSGQPAYRLARAGQPVPRAARTVEIAAIHLLRWQHPYVTCYVTCSKGTYIRSLARDVGQALGCGGHLSCLLRARSGSFTVADAVPLPLLQGAVAAGSWQELVQPMAAALPGHPSVALNAADEARIRQGLDIALDVAALPAAPEAASRSPWLAYNVAGDLIGLLVPAERPGLWHGQKVFASYGQTATAETDAGSGPHDPTA